VNRGFVLARRAGVAAILCVAVWVLLAQPAAAQTSSGAALQAGPNVFFDCDECDFAYVRQEIAFVNWVRDREDALLHLLINSTRTASGGREYVLDFIGLRKFSGTDEKLTYVASPDFTDDEERSGLTGIIKIGLLPYLSGSPVLSRLRVSYEAAEDDGASAAYQDPWDSWVFEIEGGFWGEKESSQDEISIDGSLRADRVTDAWRIRNRAYGEYERESFHQDSTTISSSSHRRRYWGAIVKSVAAHWSVGLEAQVSSSTYNNTDLSLELNPAVEYSLFDYDEVQRRRLTVAYRIGYRHVDYAERTVYNKMSESLATESMRIDLSLNQPWGEVRAALTGSHFFHDLELYRLELFSRLSVRLTRGLSLTLRGSAEQIHDQLHLPGGDATLEEILLRQRDLATTYVFSGRVGLSYTFGSIYNNVVNTRL
jgi:hypothetical protein